MRFLTKSVQAYLARMRWKALVLCILVVVSIATAATPVVADDQWADYCHRAQTVTPGSYSGTVGPNDVDWIALDLNDGQFISATLEFDAATSNTDLSVVGADRRILEWDTEHHTDSELEEKGFDGSSYIHAERALAFTEDQRELDLNRKWSSEIYPRSQHLYENRHRFSELQIYEEGRFEFQAYSSTDNRVCIGIMVRNEGSGTWKLAFSKNEGDPPEIGGAGNASELRQQLEQKDQRITELEQKVEELQAQLDAKEDGDEVTINVEVAPRGNQQSFLEGGSAVVSAESANADLSKLEIQYRGNTYSVDESGQAAIPLSDSGPQELTFSYQGTTDSITLDVQPQERETTTPIASTDDDDGGIIPVGTPGFGMIPAVLAVVGSVLLYRYCRSRGRF